MAHLRKIKEVSMVGVLVQNKGGNSEDEGRESVRTVGDHVRLCCMW